jgi:hypothetical protein
MPVQPVGTFLEAAAIRDRHRSTSGLEVALFSRC